jgi:serine/threonine-protein kinase HipA
MSTPVWLWPPGQTEPVLAAHLQVQGHQGTWQYSPHHELAPTQAPDPIALPIRRSGHALHWQSDDGLPGVVRDAMPQGYGADRIQALAGRTLTPLELLAHGLPDSAGALEVCSDLTRKLDWQPAPSSDLAHLASALDAEAPPSRAIRQFNGDHGTSQGGEKPKATVVHRGALWLAKMQDRGGLVGLPAREYVAMTLAGEVGIRVPALDLLNAGAHQIFLIQRFDRAGDPAHPRRHFFASAHTVLDLPLAATPGDPRRSYLVLADRLRRWAHRSPHLAEDLRELWQRMAYNALVGNTDDHPRNHALLHDGQTWRLSPAFDITPIHQGQNPNMADSNQPPGVVLALSTGMDRSAVATPHRLLAACLHFGVDWANAAQWLVTTATHVAARWEDRLRQALNEPSSAATQQALDRSRPAFQLATWVANNPAHVTDTAAALAQAAQRRKR